MLFKNYIPYTKNWRLRKIAAQVRNGIVPAGVEKAEIFEALRLTKPKSSLEAFGFLSAVVDKVDGTRRDYGLISVKEVTSQFADHLVTCMRGVDTEINTFNQHKMGAGSTAETSSHTALVSPQAGAQAVGGATAGTIGATANIYRSVGTLTAGSAYGCREHGVFNASTGGILLDRSVVTNIDLNTDDQVTWTYELTVNAGG